MKKEYQTPDFEVTKFVFSSLLSDDPEHVLNMSTGEIGKESGGEGLD